MATAVKKLIQNPGMAESLSSQGRLKAEEFNWEQVKNKWLDLLG